MRPDWRSCGAGPDAMAQPGAARDARGGDRGGAARPGGVSPCGRAGLDWLGLLLRLADPRPVAPSRLVAPARAGESAGGEIPLRRGAPAARSADPIDRAAGALV